VGRTLGVKIEEAYRADAKKGLKPWALYAKKAHIVVKADQNKGVTASIDAIHRLSRSAELRVRHI
jgi:hypothetical protein